MKGSPSTVSRRRLLAAALGVPLLRSSAAQTLSPRLDGDDLLIIAPDFHFISGKPLDRLRNGLSVIYLTQLSLSTDNYVTYLRPTTQRFAVSYDIWEEKFKITRMGSSPRSASNLSLGM